MYIKLKRVKIHISFLFAAAVAFALNSSTGERLIIVFVSALLHELTHTAFLLSYGVGSLVLTLSPAGAIISGDKISVLSHRQNAAVSLSAPLVNICIALLTFVSGYIFGDRLLYKISAVNLCLGAFNLLPLSFLDGGRALEAVLSTKLSCEKTASVLCVCEYAAFALLCSVCVLLIVYRVDVRFFLVFIAYCAYKLILKKHRRNA